MSDKEQARAALSATQPVQAAQPDEVSEAWCQANPGLSAKLINQRSTWLKQRQEAQAAQSEPVKPLFAAKIAARKWAELQDEGARMQSIAFDGHKSGQAGTIDPWGVVRWGQAAQGAGEAIGTLSVSHYKGLENRDFDYFGNLPDGSYTLYTHPTPAQPAPVVPEGWIDGVLREVAELPDRTSPEDEPDMMLVTADELRSILLAATPTPPAQAEQQGEKA